MRHPTLLAAAFALLAGSAHAQSFSYNHIEGGYGEVDDGDALFVGASAALDKNLYVLGSLYGVDMPHDVDGVYLEGGLGYHLPMTAQADFFVNGQLLYATLDQHHGDDDDLGAIVRAGLRYMPVQKLELEGALALSSNDLLVDDGIGLNLSARYYIQPRLSAALGVNMDTELDGLSLSLRYALK